MAAAARLSGCPLLRLRVMVGMLKKGAARSENILRLARDRSADPRTSNEHLCFKGALGVMFGLSWAICNVHKR